MSCGPASGRIDWSNVFRFQQQQVIMKVEDFLKHECNRRQFLENSARNAAGLAVGVASLGSAASASPSERVRIGVIGLGAQGRELAQELAAQPDVDVAAVADADSRLLGPTVDELARETNGPIRAERDFRRLLDDPSLDAVAIATPDHWHATMAVMACRAGKDVYVEAPLSLHLNEGRQLADVAAETDRIVQTGLQQRSGAHFRSAIELVQGGGIGRVRIAKAWVVHRRKPLPAADDSTAPRGVDYNLWLGPAAARSFDSNHFHRNWMWYWDHGGGELGLWGVHLLDVARWGLGVDWPRHVSATGGKLYFNDDRETPDTLNVQFDFDDATIQWEHRSWSRRGIEGRSAAVAFYGDDGTLIVDRGGWKVYERRESLTASSSELLGPHLRNFVDCIRSRRTPSADVETGLIAAGLCQLGNAAYRQGQPVDFDVDSMAARDDAANTLLTGTQRTPWGDALA